ncbi:hypothetical protein [Nocardioides limicola]|uniref:hypothetical protein n=1 Tax=Nocardioides limicola TaxID=2803368 RepID=UPI00193BB6F7|nr:hypothetical protein [Nocardioides sp. DJM-14]
MGDEHDDIGSAAEEAAKLFHALTDWAKESGGGLGDGVASMASQASHAFHEVNEHIATGAAECQYCPVCRVVHLVRETSPEVKTHLAVAASHFAQAAAGILATAVPDPAEGGRQRDEPRVQHIDLDDEAEDPQE